MRLCAALALVLVALVVLTVEVVRRHPHHVAPVAADAVEIAPAPPPVRAPAPRKIGRRAPPRMVVPPVVPAAIAGRLRVPESVAPDSVEILVRPTGSAQWGYKGSAVQDAFTIDGLVTGRRYDVELRGAFVRTLTLIGIVAPADGLDVALDARAVIRLAVGFPRGERCPVDMVVVHDGSTDGPEGFVNVGGAADCRFQFVAPVSTGLVTVVAHRNGEQLTAAVMISDHGDPEPICLSPPCRANPLDGLARLRFILDGAAPSARIIADVRPLSQGASTRYGCRSSIPTCEIEGLPPGQFSIDVAGPGCGAERMTISLVAGDNDVSVPCMAPTSPEDDPGEASTPEIDEGA